MPKEPGTIEALKNTFEHVQITQVPANTLSAMGEVAAASADVRLFELPSVEEGKRFETGYWNGGHISGSRPERSELQKGNVAAAFVSNSQSTQFFRGVAEVRAAGLAEQPVQRAQPRARAQRVPIHASQPRTSKKAEGGGFTSMFSAPEGSGGGW